MLITKRVLVRAFTDLPMVSRLFPGRVYHFGNSCINQRDCKRQPDAQIKLQCVKMAGFMSNLFYP